MRFRPSLPIPILACLLLPQDLYAANSRSSCISNVKTIGLALHSYVAMEGAVPTDICDAQGRPLLSWRVRLLPYLEEVALYAQFHLDEPWDSPHNRPLSEQVPRIFRCPALGRDDSRTNYLALKRDGGKLFSSEQDHLTIWVVEVDDGQSVPWSKPEDLDGRKENWLEGLGTTHGGGFFHQRGRFVCLSDGRAYLLPQRVGASSGETLLDSQNSFDLRWYQAVVDPRLKWIVIPSLLIRFVGIVGVMWVGYRLIKRKTITPGELLWFALGAGLLWHFIAVVCFYRYSLIPQIPFGCSRAEFDIFWFVPSLAAIAGSTLALVRAWRWPGWRALFAINLFLLLPVAFDASLIPHQDQYLEESFITASAPLVFGLSAILAMWLSLSPEPWQDRQLAHWLGILACVLPFVLYLVLGMAPRGLFMRSLS